MLQLLLTILCGLYSRAAFIKLSVIDKIFRECKGFQFL